MITQAELKYLAEARKVEAAAKKLRERILANLKAGVKIEPGELMCFVDVSMQKRLSWEAVETVLGATSVSLLRSHLPESTVTSLKVVSATPGAPV